MRNRILNLIIITLFMSAAGCQSSSDRNYRTIGDAPLEPGQTTFQRQRVSSNRDYIPTGDAPLEPGETTFQRQRSDDGLPEPGQIMMEGAQSTDLLPEPGQTEMQ